MGIEKKYIWIINWITRAIDSVEPIARFDFETYLPRVLKYGKYFRLLNSLNGCSEISNFELTEKAWSYNIDGAQSIDLIEELKKFDIVQFSSDRKKIQFLRNFSPYEIFSKIIIRISHEGKSFRIVQEELIISKIFELIEDGLLTPGQLAEFFEGYGPNEVFAFLAKTERGKKSLKSLITSLIIQNGYDSYDPLVRALGLTKSKGYLYPGAFQAFMGEIGGIRSLYHEKYLKPLAKRLIGDSKNARDLLIKIGWDIPTNLLTAFDKKPTAKGIRLINERIQELFGTTYKEAKRIHSTGYLGGT